MTWSERQEEMATKLAITVAGAVSLGSYEAGVLYELLDAIAQHNGGASDENKIFIDVLTGASAGGMSTTVLAQKLLFEADSLADPYDNVLYQAWVRDIQLQGLLALQQGEDPSHSILSSNLVEDLSKKYLCQRYSTPHPPSPVRHPAAAETIRLGLALSNLNGIDYSHQMRPKQTFTYTRFQDQLYATIDSRSDAFAFWEPLRKAAVSCGAFPFAFRVKDLSRHRNEHDPTNIVSPSGTFAYTDGGVFQNEPLGLAKNLVDEIDRHIDTESRFYIFIAPHTKKSTAHSHFNESNANFKTTAAQLFNAVYGQAGFQDWIQAEQVNAQIDVFNRRAVELKDVLVRGQIQPASLRDAAGSLLPLLFAGRPESAETIDHGRRRLNRQFHVEYDELASATSSGVADIWIDSILALETAAELGSRDEMVMYGITAGAQELAGSGLEAFVGFCEREYRDHDYDVGRAKARDFLRNGSGLLGTDGNLPVIHYTPKPIREINHHLDGATLADVPRDLRETLNSRLDDRANDLLKELNMSWLMREAVDLFFIHPHLRKLLDL
jgi:Patatin-like phospholipase